MTRKLEGHFTPVVDVEFADCLEGEILRVMRSGKKIGVAVVSEVEDLTDSEIEKITAVVEHALRRMRANMLARKGRLTQ